MKHLILVSILISACAVDAETSDTEQAIASTAAIEVCRNDTTTGYLGLTIHGVELYGYESEELWANYYGGAGSVLVTSTSTDCSGNLAITAQVSATWLANAFIHEPASNTNLLVPLPANGACAYTGGYSSATWSYPLTSCGGSTGGGGGLPGHGGSHLLM